jgi:ACS family D-galactonate transporter-like MFS transporter
MGAGPLASAPLAADLAASTVDRKQLRRWVVLGVLCLIYICSWIDRVKLPVALADAKFKAFFHVTDVDRGWLNSAFGWTYAILQIPAGWLVDRFGAKRSLTFGFLLWSLTGAGTGLVSTFGQLFVMRLVLGIAETVVTPGGMRWIRYNVPEKHRGLAIGIFMAAAKIGPSIGNLVAPAFLIAFGWQHMFIYLGLGALVCVVPWVLLVENNDRRLEAAQRAAAPAPAVDWGVLLRTRVLWGTLLGTFCYQYFNYFCLNWMQAYFIERRHFSMEAMSHATSASYAGFAAVAIASAWWADRLIARGGDAVNVRRRFAMAGMVLASTELIGAFSPSSSVALFFAVFSLSGLGLATANYWALTQTLLPGAGVGRLVGIQNCAANLPAIVAPLLTGWLKQKTGSYEAPMLTVGIFLILGVASYRFLVRREYAPRFS